LLIIALNIIGQLKKCVDHMEAANFLQNLEFITERTRVLFVVRCECMFKIWTLISWFYSLYCL